MILGPGVIMLWLLINRFNPKYLEWYSPSLDLEHTVQIYRGERVKVNSARKAEIF